MAIFVGLSLANFLYTFLTCLLITLAAFKFYRERNYPPGPTGIPVLGYNVFLGKKTNETLRDLSRKYGNIFSLYLGTDLYMCVTDFQVLKELLMNPALLFRPPETFSFILGRGGFGGMNGEEWQEQRRFAFYTMRNLGLGKGQWETMILENIVDLVDELRNWKGHPNEIESPIANSQSYTNVSLLLGRQLDKDKDAEKLKILRYSTREFMQFFSAASANVSMSWLRGFMKTFNIAGMRRFFELLHQFENIFKDEVEERMRTPESLDKDDFIGLFFKELEKKKEETANHSFTMENLMGNLLMLFIAGNDSTTASVSWLLLIMADRPDIQKKVHEEIDSVIGRDGRVSYDDRKKFPYTMATMLEMTRWVAVAPLLPPRLAMEDIKCNGYVIPKGAHVIANIWAIMRDPKYFEKPDEFIPERFLVENGTKVSRMDGYTAFSLGKRNCPGEGVAIMAMFIYFISLMQKFEVTVPPGKVVDMEPIFGGAFLPRRQNLCFLER